MALDPPTAQQLLRVRQRTVRAPASLYTMALGALASHRGPPDHFSDSTSSAPAAVVPSRGDSTRRTVTRLRPGALAPGGVGADRKHGYYGRYLNTIKARGPLRAAPGATGVVAGCDCGGAGADTPNPWCGAAVNALVSSADYAAPFSPGARVLAHRPGARGARPVVSTVLEIGRDSAVLRFPDGSVRAVPVRAISYTPVCCDTDPCCASTPASYLDQLAAKMAAGRATGADACRLLAP